MNASVLLRIAAVLILLFGVGHSLGYPWVGNVTEAQQTGDVEAGLDPKRFTVRTAPALFEKSSAWKDYDSAAASLRDAIRKLTARGRSGA